LRDVEDPTLSTQSAQMAMKLSASRTGRTPLLRNSVLLLLVLISVKRLCKVVNFKSYHLTHSRIRYHWVRDRVDPSSCMDAQQRTIPTDAGNKVKRLSYLWI
jgi:hypothetical protein